MRTVIGPLNGWNLRNVTWHGFVTPPQEFSPCYTSFLMVLTMSLADLVSSRGDTNKARGRRELWYLDELTKDSSFAKEVNLLGMKQTYSCIIISSSLSPMLILLLVLLYNRYDTREGQPPDCGVIQRELLCFTSNRNYVAALMEGYLLYLLSLYQIHLHIHIHIHIHI